MRRTFASIAAVVVGTLALSMLLFATPTRAQTDQLAVGRKVFLPLVIGTGSPEPPAEPPPAPADPTVADQVLALVNSERARAGCRPVTLDARLSAAALAHSQDMASNNYFDHTGADGSSAADRVTRAGYDWSMTGENIAAGYDSPAEVMAGWMDSPGHRANILNCQYAHMGLGYVYEAGDSFPGPYGYSHYWTQAFGRP